jgi:heme/copper-type cytochrome/quinol oxidase subunit 2
MPSAKTAAIAFASLTILAMSALPVHAGDASSQLRFERGSVEPARLTIPANAPVKLQVTNAGDAPVEFESFELHRERVVQPGQTITVYIPALAPGAYPFVDDFSHGATGGEIIAR